MSQSFWIAIDENGDETIHQYEPYYNQLHMKWISSTKTYVSKGISGLIVDYKMEVLVKAVAIELLGNLNLSSKLNPITIKRIYKG
jgi:hypothetical protein